MAVSTKILKKMKHLLFNPHRMNAILQRGFDQTNLVGSVGGVTYRRVGGVTVASQKVPMHVTHTQTARLMLTRMKWVNLVALWKAINQTGWHPSFLRENRRVSDFNMFLRTNFASANTFIEKNISRSMGAVVAPVRLTSGSSLSSIVMEVGESGNPESNLAIQIALGQSTTLKAFSDDVIANNPGWQDGDKLVVLIVRQAQVDGVPVAESTALAVTLDTTAYTTPIMLSDLIDVSLLANIDGYLALSGPVNGGFAMVHSRIIDGETRCSNATLVVANNILSEYQGLTAFNKAAESYGGIARTFLLTPDTDDFIAENL